MAEPSQGDIAGGRIASIVVEALEPAERNGGVAYLCVTPFAAGQTLAVPLQPIAIDRDCYGARRHGRFAAAARSRTASRPQILPRSR